MKSKLILTLCISSVFLLSSCMNSRLAPNGTNYSTIPAQNNATILGTMVALNKNEIAAAREAKHKAANPAVKQYATMLYNQHSGNLTKTLRLSRKLGVKPEMNDLALMVRDNGRQEMAHLSPLKGNAFDQAYINDMVNDHTEALQLIDQVLLKNASNAAVTDYLVATRAHIIVHLEKAKMIQRQLMS